MISSELIDTVMWQCIRIAEENNTPFGAAIINREGTILTIAANTTKTDGPTGHAEMNAIRELCRYPEEEGLILVTTVEPCPMCAGAAVWAKLSAVYFGADIKDAAQVFHQIDISCRDIAEASWLNIPVSGSHLREDCVKLLERLSK